MEIQRSLLQKAYKQLMFPSAVELKMIIIFLVSITLKITPWNWLTLKKICIFEQNNSVVYKILEEEKLD